jgi:hypothetical protein
MLRVQYQGKENIPVRLDMMIPPQVVIKRLHRWPEALEVLFPAIHLRNGLDDSDALTRVSVMLKDSKL